MESVNELLTVIETGMMLTKGKITTQNISILCNTVTDGFKVALLLSEMSECASEAAK